MRGYDAWVTRDPYSGPDEPLVINCGRCGGFLRKNPDSIEDKEQTRDGVVEWGWMEHVRVCGKCGYENREVC